MENLSWREMGFVNCCIELMTAKAAGKVPVPISKVGSTSDLTKFLTQLPL